MTRISLLISFTLTFFLVGVSAKASNPDADVFFSIPQFGQPSLSPDGQWVSVLDFRSAPITALFIAPTDLSSAPQSLELGGLSVETAFWVDNDRLLVVANTQKNIKLMDGFGGTDNRDRFVRGDRSGQLILIDADGSNRIDIDATLIDPRRDGIPPNDISLPGGAGGPIGVFVDDTEPILYKIDPQFGTVSKVKAGKASTISMRLKADGRAGLTITRNEKSFNWKVMTENGAVTLRYEDLLLYRLFGFSDDGKSILFAKTSDESDTMSLYKVGPNREITGPISENLRFDVTHLHRTRRGKLIGAQFYGGPEERVIFDASHSKHFDALQKFFGDESLITLYDTSADDQVWVIYIESPSEPGAYFLYNRRAGAIDHLLDRSAPVDSSAYSPMQVFSYSAQDGTSLFGFLTEPKNVTANTPLLVMPHGGPHSRDEYGFDGLAQYFAAQGYRVFQPQFRGSTGQGSNFEVAGYKQWGKLMQDDITDGVMALIAKGKARRGRIAIAGISYGGYAALWGAIKQPELYTTAIAVNPASDIADQIEFFYQKYWRYKGYEDQLYQTFGNPDEDAEYLSTQSPLTHISELQIPVLLIHGTYDDTVPVRQSRKLSKAAEAAGVSLKYIEVKEAGHSLESDIGEYTLTGEQIDYLAALKITLGKMTDHLDEIFKE